MPALPGAVGAVPRLALLPRAGQGRPTVLIHYAGWIATRADEPAFQRAFPWLLQPKWWEDHVLTLREQMAALDEPVLDWRP
jgi:hypothetical protein